MRLDEAGPLYHGITVRPSAAAPRSTAARAHGQLEILVLNGVSNDDITDDHVLDVTRSPLGARLRELYWQPVYPAMFMRSDVAERLLRATQLTVLDVDVFACTFAHALLMLRNEAPFEALRMRCLNMEREELGHIGDADLLLLAATLPKHRQVAFVVSSHSKRYRCEQQLCLTRL